MIGCDLKHFETQERLQTHSFEIPPLQLFHIEVPKAGLMSGPHLTISRHKVRNSLHKFVKHLVGGAMASHKYQEDKGCSTAIPEKKTSE
jgi:hypothetical protein